MDPTRLNNGKATAHFANIKGSYRELFKGRFLSMVELVFLYSS